MADLKIRTRNAGALAVLPPGGLPVITTPTGGTVDVVTQVSAPGFSPLDLLHASLAACMVLSARIAATRLGVADRLGEVRADVSGEKATDEPSRVETFIVKLEIAGDLDDATKERILADAENICTVSNTLRGAPALRSTLG
ncbi:MULTISPECIES: OsmC family protein [unclassified Mesorhizobium]|uniref:OsmC family protein n=1 Tax=unclassified Mesorhizobium TaxID=325217 RepID=UPI00112EB6C8|nr:MULTISPECIES: OsmC family protein [unclassified Mesorhizobium]MBZ9840936.1 OsmC family protein [Mesorhizobium sp. CA5]TPI72381.1 OsmC family protein [Mesorhizobium sp. B2-8-9]